MRFQFSLLPLILFLALATGSAWADEVPDSSPNDSSQSSNIDSWLDEDEEDDEGPTFFGMGFELRTVGNLDPGATANTAAGGVSGGGVQKGGGSKGGRR